LEDELIIKQSDIRKLIDHAENCRPLEAVALLFGIFQDDRIIVRTVELVDNSANSKTTFMVDPVVQYNLLIESEARGEDLVCVFHSHPAPPKPSSKDIKNMELNPVVWLIGSKNTGEWELKAFLLDQDKEPLEISIVTSSEEP